MTASIQNTQDVQIYTRFLLGQDKTATKTAVSCPNNKLSYFNLLCQCVSILFIKNNLCVKLPHQMMKHNLFAEDHFFLGDNKSCLVSCYDNAWDGTHI